MNVNLDLERCAIHAALGGDGTIVTRLIPEDFHEPLHRKIFESLYEDFRDNGSCDMNRVHHKLSGQEWYEKRNGSVFLCECTAPNWPYTPEHQIVDMLRELLIRRTAGEFSVSRSSAREIIDQFARETEDMRNLLPNASRPSRDVLRELLKGAPRTIPFGFPCLDQFVSMAPGQLVVVGARTGSGKTAFLCNVACNYARTGKPIVYCTKEMTQEEILPRFLSNLAGRPFRSLGEDAHRFESVVDRIAVEERVEHVSDVETLASRTDAEVVIVDYLQLLTLRGRRPESRVQELEEITRRLKATAQRTGKVVLCASQLNRDLDTAGRRPTLSDLRGCGSIEMDANTVILLYNPFAGEVGGEGTDGKWGSRKQVNQTAADLVGDRGMIEFWVSKNRSGRTGMCKLRWIPEITTFADVSGKPPLPSALS